MYNVIIDKDVFVEQFYNKLWNEIKDWKSVKVEPWAEKINKHSEKLIKKLNDYIGIN